MIQDKKNSPEPVTPDTFEFEAFDFPREIIARKLFGQKVNPAYTQQFKKLKRFSPTFQSIIAAMEETITVNGYRSFKQWMDYDLGLTNRFAALMQKRFETKKEKEAEQIAISRVRVVRLQNGGRVRKIAVDKNVVAASTVPIQEAIVKKTVEIVKWKSRNQRFKKETPQERDIARTKRTEAVSFKKIKLAAKKNTLRMKASSSS